MKIQRTVLDQYTAVYLTANARPFLDLTVDAYESTFPYLRVGNTVSAHVADVYLPGGLRGWYGSARILAMAYDEDANTVKMTLRGTL